MKRTLVVGGSVGAVVLLVLAAMPSVVSSNTVNEKSSYFSQGKIQLNELLEKIEQSWMPGSLIGLVVILFLVFWTIGSFFMDFILDWIRGA